jgi:hypothetical protein
MGPPAFRHDLVDAFLRSHRNGSDPDEPLRGGPELDHVEAFDHGLDPTGLLGAIGEDERHGIGGGIEIRLRAGATASAAAGRQRRHADGDQEDDEAENQRPLARKAIGRSRDHLQTS